jgi:hypothetical protein
MLLLSDLRCADGANTDIKDETGKEVKAEKGDVFLFPKGSRIIFRTDDYGLAFFVGQRNKDVL